MDLSTLPANVDESDFSVKKVVKSNPIKSIPLKSISI